MTRSFLPISFLATLLSAAAVTVAMPVRAQSPMDNAIRQADEINRRLTTQAREREERAARELNRPPAPAPSGTQMQPSLAAGGNCAKVDRIHIDGANLVSPAVLQSAVAPWQGRCLTLAELNDVLSKVTLLYVSRGYVASRAYLPEQDLSGGVLDVKVIEGQLTDIAVKSGRLAPSQLATAFPGMKGKPVNLRRIEQGLDQINRMRSARATTSLEAGREMGDSVLGVGVENGKPWSITASSDNAGSTSTGYYQSSLGVGFDNLLELNDQWSFDYQRSAAHNPFDMFGDIPNSNSFSGSFSVPYGAWTFGVDASASNYHSSIQGLFSEIDTKGQSKSLSPYATWIFHRDQTSKSWLTGRLTWKTTENFMLGSRLDNASRSLAVASTEIGHSRQLLGGELSASLSYKRGLDILGAFDDGTAAAGSPQAQYQALAYSLGYTRSLEAGPATANFSSSLSGQWTPDRLFASEQMSLGGNSTIRGTREALLSASTAVLSRNEVSLDLPAFGPDALQHTLGRLEPYVGIDIGHSRADPADGSIGGTMTGAVAGLRNRGGRLNFDISYARILSVAGASRPESGLFQARMSVKF